MSGAAGFATSLGFAAAVAAICLALERLGALTFGTSRQRPAGEEGSSVYLGTATDSGEAVRVGLDELQQGTLVGGSPGAGKTTLLVAIGTRLPSRVGAVFIDLKGDRSLPARLGIAPECVFGLGDRCSAAWNPLQRGNAASWRDILMSTQEFSEPHYRQSAARYVGACLGALAVAEGDVELDRVIELLEQPKRTAGVVRGLPEGFERDALVSAASAIGAEASLRSGVLGLGNRLALLRDSPATKRLLGSPGGIDLDRAFGGQRVLFSLPAAEFPEEAPAIAAAVIQSLGAAGQRLAAGEEELRTLLVVDEAPRLGGDQLREAVAIGRGAGIGTVVAVQDFADLDYVADGTREAVETGANTWIVMRQVASAEQIANSFGSRLVKRHTVQRDSHRLLGSDTGMRSEREVDAFQVSPNEIRSLGRGEAIVWRRLRGELRRIEVEAGGSLG